MNTVQFPPATGMGVVPGAASLLAQSKVLVHAAIDAVVASGTPSEKIVLGGFSQGGAMAIYAGYSYPKRLAGIVGFSGWAAGRSIDGGFHDRVTGGQNSATPCFIGHGTEDEVVLPACGEDAKKRLEDAGVPVNYSTYRMAHSSCAFSQARLRAVTCFGVW